MYEDIKAEISNLLQVTQNNGDEIQTQVPECKAHTLNYYDKAFEVTRLPARSPFHDHRSQNAEQLPRRAQQETQSCICRI